MFCLLLLVIIFFGTTIESPKDRDDIKSCFDKLSKLPWPIKISLNERHLTLLRFVKGKDNIEKTLADIGG